MIENSIEKVKSYQTILKRWLEEDEKTGEPSYIQYLKDDIEGYQLLIDSNSEKNVKEFFDRKKIRYRRAKSNRTNLTVVNEIKVSGDWE